RLQQERLLLNEDVQRIIAVAAASKSFVPVVTGITLDRAVVGMRGSFSVTVSGRFLSENTYFDVAFRRPGSTADEVALNWQKNTSSTHILTDSFAIGAWTITGVRAHDDINDHSGGFNTVSASLVVSLF